MENLFSFNFIFSLGQTGTGQSSTDWKVVAILFYYPFSVGEGIKDYKCVFCINFLCISTSLYILYLCHFLKCDIEAKRPNGS